MLLSGSPGLKVGAAGAGAAPATTVGPVQNFWKADSPSVTPEKLPSIRAFVWKTVLEPLANSRVVLAPG